MSGTVIALPTSLPVWSRPVFVRGPFAEALALGDVAQLVRLFREDPALVLHVSQALHTLTEEQVAAREGAVRVLWAACELYAAPRRAVAL
jgi:hypothetical protein